MSAHRIPSPTKLERSITPAGDAITGYLAADQRTRRTMARAARASFARIRAGHGFTSPGSLLTSPDAQPKTGKSEVPTFTVMMTPARHSGLANVCPAATSCADVCLSTAGKGGMPVVQRSRLARTELLVSDPFAWGVLLAAETVAALGRHGAIALRLNCLSDVRWELAIPDALRALRAAGVTLYDYSKYSPRLRGRLDGYSITYSAHERMTDADVVALTSAGLNVAMVFAVRRGQPLPATYLGVPVIDGDLSDYRPADPAGVVVGLRAKGAAIHDTSGFVRGVPMALAA